MRQTGHGRICCKYNGDRKDPAYKISHKGGNINTDLIECFTKIISRKEVRKSLKNVYPFVKSIKPSTLADSKTLSNKHNNPISSVD